MPDMASQLMAGKEAALAALGDKNGRGGARRLARKLDISESAVSQWPAIPVEHVPAVEGLTDIARHVLRPDIYEAPKKYRRTAPPSRRKAA